MMTLLMIRNKLVSPTTSGMVCSGKYKRFISMISVVAIIQNEFGQLFRLYLHHHGGDGNVLRSGEP